MASHILRGHLWKVNESIWDYYLCYPAILTNTLVPQPGLSSILQNQLGVALDALTGLLLLVCTSDDLLPQQVALGLEPLIALP